ncbi:MAG: hypothetical protein JWQ69_2502, partial [Pseudomonas sp.]|nr:hypothetical protein [Pseudomonas sp.]
RDIAFIWREGTYLSKAAQVWLELALELANKNPSCC